MVRNARAQAAGRLGLNTRPRGHTGPHPDRAPVPGSLSLLTSLQQVAQGSECVLLNSLGRVLGVHPRVLHSSSLRNQSHRPEGGWSGSGTPAGLPGIRPGGVTSHWELWLPQPLLRVMGGDRCPVLVAPPTAHRARSSTVSLERRWVPQPQVAQWPLPRPLLPLMETEECPLANPSSWPNALRPTSTQVTRAPLWKGPALGQE